MKTTYRHPLEQNDTLKYIALIVGALIILVLVFCLGSMTHVTAADNQAGVESISTPSKIDYQQLYDESLLEIDALKTTIQELTEANSQLEEANDEYAEREEALNEEILTLKEEARLQEETNQELEEEVRILEETNQALEEKVATLKEAYGTSYHVEYEIRKKGLLFGAEDILRIHSVVEKQTYENTVLNMELPLVSETYSIPSGSRTTTWNVVACNKYPVINEID